MDNRDEKIKAAYALNLCTVSVSQILDNIDKVLKGQAGNPNIPSVSQP